MTVPSPYPGVMVEYEPGWYHVEDGEKVVGDPIPQDSQFVTHGDAWSRGLARFFDSLFLFAGLFAVNIAVGSVLSSGTATTVVTWIVSTFGLIAYEVGLVATKGATLGKRMFNLVVVDKRLQSPPGWLAALQRTVPVWVAYALVSSVFPEGTDAETSFISGFSLLFCFLALNALLIAVTPQHRSLYDLVGRTQVVAEQSPQR